MDLGSSQSRAIGLKTTWEGHLTFEKGSEGVGREGGIT